MSFTEGSGVIGLPDNTKEGGKRVDYKANSKNETDFDFLISTKTPRFAWSRATQCPCRGRHNSDATEMPDPNCTACTGLGWRYFTPHDVDPADKDIGELTDVQKTVLARAKSVVIRALAISASSSPDLFEVLGDMGLGSVTITTRPKNRMGYYDRLVALDDEMVYSELQRYEGSPLRLHYPPVSLNHVVTITGKNTFAEFGPDAVEIDAAGCLTWTDPTNVPPDGALVSVHYLCMPVFMIAGIDKFTRTSLIKQKRSSFKTPQGDALHLPHRYVAQLSHLMMESEEDRNATGGD